MYQKLNRVVIGMILPVFVLIFLQVGRSGLITEYLFNRDFHFDFIFAYIIGFLVWQTILFLTKTLDKYFPWRINVFQRALVQLSIAVLLPLVILSLLYFGYLKLYYGEAYTFDLIYYFTIDFPLGLILVIILNLLLVLAFFINDGSQHLPVSENENNKVKQRFVVGAGNSKRVIALEDIAYFQLNNGLIIIHLFSGEKITTGETIDYYNDQLPQNFFRANRQTIINSQAVKGYSAERSGKLIIRVNPESTTLVTVSQKKSVEFKNWLSMGV